jgi:hypothetical protein
MARVAKVACERNLWHATGFSYQHYHRKLRRVETGFAATWLPPRVHLGLELAGPCAPSFSSVRHLQRRSVSSDTRDLC